MRYDGIRVYNPFRHFGQPYLRPKGFPFETVVQYGDNIDNYILSITKTPLIQHGLVNGDPDIDRSFISSSSKTSINIAFDGKAPPAIIPKGIFSPFNSKNTLFLYDALWAMVLPLMSSDSDILRGYWAQRLLWEIGGTVGFYPPNTFYNQSYNYTRNNDASKFKPSVLINFLNNWRCPVNLTFFQCVQFLSRDMADHRFWSRSDYQIIFSWLIDLQINGYREPKRQPYNIPETYINLASISYHSTGSENSNLHLKWRQKISKISTICEDSSYQTTNVKPVLISNILLIIVFNFPFYDNIPYLQLMYSVTFNNIVYCGNDIQTFITSSKKFPENVTFLEQDVYAGYFAYRCITAAMKMNYRVQGYLTIGDDVLLNSWNILKSDLPFDKFWFTEFEILYRNQDSYWPWWHKQNGRVVFNKAWEKILNIPDEVIELQPIAHKFVETLRNNTGSVQGLFYNTSDIVYIPHAYKEEIILFMDIFSSYNVFVEVTIPSVIAGLVPLQQIVKLKGQYIWGDERYKIPVHFKDDDIYIHPVKLSQLSLLGDLLCKSYFSLLIRNGTMKQS